MPKGSSQENTPSEPVYDSETQDAAISQSDRQSLRNFADILEQILSSADHDANAKVDPCQDELLAVASKYSSLSFCTDPVLMELIQVVTRRINGVSLFRMSAMERAVAASLTDDQVSLGHLQNFWEQLKGLASNGK